METAEKVVAQTFEELRAMLRSDECLIVSIGFDGYMVAGLLDSCDAFEGGFIADSLSHVINVLADRIK